MVQWLGEINRAIEFPSELTNWIRSKEDEANETVKALLSRHTIKDLLLNLFFVAGLAAVGEELLFRGVVQRIFVRQLDRPGLRSFFLHFYLRPYICSFMASFPAWH